MNQQDITGRITLLIDGIAVKRLTYDSKASRQSIIDEWAKYRLGEISYTIHPDEVVLKPESTIKELNIPAAVWDLQRTYRKPRFEQQEYHRPAAEYSNKGYDYLLNLYA